MFYSLNLMIIKYFAYLNHHGKLISRLVSLLYVKIGHGCKLIFNLISVIVVENYAWVLVLLKKWNREFPCFLVGEIEFWFYNNFRELFVKRN